MHHRARCSRRRRAAVTRGATSRRVSCHSPAGPRPAGALSASPLLLREILCLSTHSHTPRSAARSARLVSWPWRCPPPGRRRQPRRRATRSLVRLTDVSINKVPYIVAKEEGLFAKHGIDADLYITSGAAATVKASDVNVPPQFVRADQGERGHQHGRWRADDHRAHDRRARARPRHPCDHRPCGPLARLREARDHESRTAQGQAARRVGLRELQRVHRPGDRAEDGLAPGAGPVDPVRVAWREVAAGRRGRRGRARRDARTPTR